MIPLRDVIPTRTWPVVTVGLIMLNVVVFLHEQTLGRHGLELFVREWGLVPADFAWDRVVTSMFLHGGWAHIGGNMLYLWIFGDNVEDRMGHVRFLLFYVLCGLAAGGLHVLTNGNSLAPTVGASGAIAGVLGAYFLLFPRARVLTLVPIVFIPLFFELPAVTFLLIWFGLQVIQGWAGMGAEEGGVAWWAHVGGFGAGILLHRLFLEREPPRPRWSSRRYADD